MSKIAKLFKSKKANKHATEKGYQELSKLIKESSEKHEVFCYVPCVVNNLRARADREYFRTSKI